MHGMSERDQRVLEYVEREVRGCCEARGMGHQIRRAWNVREKPVAESGLADYEWKLIPDSSSNRQNDGDYEGRYFVLSIDPAMECLWFQHDTFHVGHAGDDHRKWQTFTKIAFRPFSGTRSEDGRNEVAPRGWLSETLATLTKRFNPNVFSYT